MSKVSCEAAGKHRRCGFANGASELCDAKESTEGAALRMAREKFLKRYLRKTFSYAILTMSTGKK